MARLIYGMITSLDGYTEDTRGGSRPRPARLRLCADLRRPYSRLSASLGETAAATAFPGAAARPAATPAAWYDRGSRSLPAWRSA